MRLVRFLDNLIARIEGGMLLVLLSLMVTLSFFQVLLRNFFALGLPWGEILLRHMVLWVGFLGASLAAKKRRHLNIEVLSRFMPAGLRPMINILIFLFTIIVCLALFWASLLLVISEREMGGKLFGNFPTWVFQLILPIAFALIGLHYLLRTVGRFWLLCKLKRRRDSRS